MIVYMVLWMSREVIIINAVVAVVLITYKYLKLVQRQAIQLTSKLIKTNERFPRGEALILRG